MTPILFLFPSFLFPSFPPYPPKTLPHPHPNPSHKVGLAVGAPGVSFFGLAARLALVAASASQDGHGGQDGQDGGLLAFSGSASGSGVTAAAAAAASVFWPLAVGASLLWLLGAIRASQRLCADQEVAGTGGGRAGGPRGLVSTFLSTKVRADRLCWSVPGGSCPTALSLSSALSERLSLRWPSRRLSAPAPPGRCSSSPSALLAPSRAPCPPPPPPPLLPSPPPRPGSAPRQRRWSRG